MRWLGQALKALCRALWQLLLVLCSYFALAFKMLGEAVRQVPIAIGRYIDNLFDRLLGERWRRFKWGFVCYCIISTLTVHLVGGYMGYKVVEPFLNDPPKIADVVAATHQRAVAAVLADAAPTKASQKTSVAVKSVPASPKAVQAKTKPISVCYGNDFAEQFAQILRDAGTVPVASCKPDMSKVMVVYEGPEKQGECYPVKVFLRFIKPGKDSLTVPERLDQANIGQEVCWGEHESREDLDGDIKIALTDLRKANYTLFRDRIKEMLPKL